MECIVLAHYAKLLKQEFQATIYAVCKFHQYLLGNKFVITTQDCWEKKLERKGGEEKRQGRKRMKRKKKKKITHYNLL